MDNYKELIERLHRYADFYNKLGGFSGASIEYEQAAAALTALMEENVQLRAELEQVKRERDAAVAHLRTYQVYVNSCAFCKHDHDCDKQGPGRKSVEGCWEWRGPQKEDQ